MTSSSLETLLSDLEAKAGAKKEAAFCAQAILTACKASILLKPKQTRI